MPDDMLEDAISIAKKSLDEHDFETNGVKVSFMFYWFGGLTDSRISEVPHGPEMGALLACVPGQLVRVPRGPREQPIRLLHIRT